MLGLTLHPPGEKMRRLIYSLFIVIFKASIYCQKTFIIVYLILTNKFLLKTIKNILLIISAQERVGVASKQNEIYRIGIGQNELKNIGISAKIQYRASLE